MSAFGAAHLEVAAVALQVEAVALKVAAIEGCTHQHAWWPPTRGPHLPQMPRMQLRSRARVPHKVLSVQARMGTSECARRHHRASAWLTAHTDYDRPTAGGARRNFMGERMLKESQHYELKNNEHIQTIAQQQTMLPISEAELWQKNFWGHQN